MTPDDSNAKDGTNVIAWSLLVSLHTVHCTLLEVRG